MDGNYVIIKTKIDNSEAEKGLALLKVKLLTGLKTAGRLVGSLLRTVLSASVIMAGALGGIFGAAGLAYGFKKAIEDSDTLRGNLQYLVAMVQVAVKNIAEKMLPTILNIMNAIVNAVYKALVYINYITRAWFKLDLFAGASDQFAENMSKAEKSSKKIKNNLQQAPFDEMNVLSDNSAADDTKKGLGAGTPNFPDMSSFEVPWWIDWIAKNKDLVIAALGGITAALIAMKLLGIDPIMALGIGVLVGGIILAIESLIAYLNDPSWENFGGIVQGIGIALLGLALIIGSIPVAVAGAIVLILGTIMKYWEDIKAFLQKGIDWLFGKSDDIHKKFGDIVGNIYDITVRKIQRLLDWFDMTFKNIRIIFDNLIQFIKNVFTGNWKSAWENVKNIFGAIWDWIKNTAKAIITNIFDTAITFGRNVGEAIGSAFKFIVNKVLQAMENILNTPIRAINNLIDVINAVPGINLGTLNTFNLPRLEKGGIINRPGAGVPIGGAIGGERGAEWVQPLTDEQSLDLVADRIGKRIVIDLTNVVDINGRQLQRDFKRINSESNFAYNR